MRTRLDELARLIIKFRGIDWNDSTTTLSDDDLKVLDCCGDVTYRQIF